MTHLSQKQIQNIINGITHGTEAKDALLHVEACSVCQLKMPALGKNDLFELINSEPNFLNESDLAVGDRGLQISGSFWNWNWNSGISKIGFAGLLLAAFAGISFWFLKDSEKAQIVINPTNTTNSPIPVNSNPVEDNRETVVSNPDREENRNTVEIAKDDKVPTKKQNENLPKIVAVPKQKKEIGIDQNPLENKELALNLDPFPKPLVGLASPNVQIRGNQDKQVRISTKYPVGEVVRENQPVLRWDPVENAKSYQVSIYDENYTEIYTKQVTGANLKVETFLKRGEKFQWQVKANLNDDKQTTVTSSPSIFSVAKDEVAGKIEKIETKSNLRWKKVELLFNEGLLSEAEKTLNEILVKDRKNKLAQKYLQKIKNLKKKTQNPPTETKPAQ
jgi:hypothetical protein